MAKVLKQICLYDRTIKAGDDELHLKRGQEYTTSPVRKDDTVRVYSSYWVWVPADWFGGLIDPDDKTLRPTVYEAP